MLTFARSFGFARLTIWRLPDGRGSGSRAQLALRRPRGPRTSLRGRGATCPRLRARLPGAPSSAARRRRRAPAGAAVGARRTRRGSSSSLRERAGARPPSRGGTPPPMPLGATSEDEPGATPTVCGQPKSARVKSCKSDTADAGATATSAPTAAMPTSRQAAPGTWLWMWTSSMPRRSATLKIRSSR